MTKRKEIEVKRKRKKLLKEGKVEIERRRAEKRERRKRREFAKGITLRKEEAVPAFNIMERCDYCGELKMSWEVTIDDSLVAKNMCFSCKKSFKNS